MRVRLALLISLAAAAPAGASTSINYGSISHSGLKNLGAEEFWDSRPRD